MYMFSRWAQENFFRYMRQEYDLDRIVQYVINELNKLLIIVNPEYNNINHRLKKIREKIALRQASLYSSKEENAKKALGKPGNTWQSN